MDHSRRAAAIFSLLSCHGAGGRMILPAVFSKLRIVQIINLGVPDAVVLEQQIAVF